MFSLRILVLLAIVAMVLGRPQKKDEYPVDDPLVDEKPVDERNTEKGRHQMLSHHNGHSHTDAFGLGSDHRTRHSRSPVVAAVMGARLSMFTK